jgi:hypothetical protein
VIFGPRIFQADNPTISYWHSFVESPPEVVEQIKAAFKQAKVAQPVYPERREIQSDIT